MTSAPALTETILALEARRIDAMVKKDIPTLEALLADELSYTHSGGHSDTKGSFLELISSGRGQYLGVDFPDRLVIPWGDNAAVVRGTAVISLANRDPYAVFFVDVWALRDGAWRLLAWQATRVAPPGTPAH